MVVVGVELEEGASCDVGIADVLLGVGCAVKAVKEDGITELLLVVVAALAIRLISKRAPTNPSRTFSTVSPTVSLSTPSSVTAWAT